MFRTSSSLMKLPSAYFHQSASFSGFEDEERLIAVG
ncbi:hypothetical protein PSE_4644 [Pseudovibrio sp. FO-BEG1]|nr:hypothetical protein PSE_4644 [Pseudovibrio sp. FO-BEG1]